MWRCQLPADTADCDARGEGDEWEPRLQASQLYRGLTVTATDATMIRNGTQALKTRALTADRLKGHTRTSHPTIIGKSCYIHATCGALNSATDYDSDIRFSGSCLVLQNKCIWEIEELFTFWRNLKHTFARRIYLCIMCCVMYWYIVIMLRWDGLFNLSRPKTDGEECPPVSGQSREPRNVATSGQNGSHKLYQKHTDNSGQAKIHWDHKKSQNVKFF